MNVKQSAMKIIVFQARLKNFIIQIFKEFNTLFLQVVSTQFIPCARRRLFHVLIPHVSLMCKNETAVTLTIYVNDKRLIKDVLLTFLLCWEEPPCPVRDKTIKLFPSIILTVMNLCMSHLLA